MKQRILVIKEVLGARNDIAFSLVEPYIKERLREGSFVNVHETQSNILKSLLEEEEIWHGEIIQKEIDLMFDINSYDKVVYVSQDALKPSDILVYDPEELDKNMIFYYIGNMQLKEKYDTVYEEHVKSAESDNGTESNLKNYSGDIRTKSDKKLWILISVIPWLIFLVMFLFNYRNMAGIPFVISISTLFVKRFKNYSDKDYMLETVNVSLFLIILFSNYQNYSWIANIAPVISVMGIVLILLLSKLDLEEI